MVARYLLIIAVALCGTSNLFAQDADEATRAARHARAVEALRRGEFDSSIPALRDLYQAYPGNPDYLHDYVVALSWSQQDAAALELEPLLDVASTPIYVVDAIAKSARNLGATGVAEKWYLRAIELDPENVEFRLGLAYSYAESQRYAEAERVIADLTPSEQAMPEVLTARSYILRLAGRQIAALRVYDQILETRPDDRDALRGKALLLRDLLLPTQALELAEQHPGILTDSEIERLEVDALAVQLRLASQTIYPKEIDGVMLDDTIGEIDSRLSAAGDESAAVLALRYDRIAALTERNEAEAAIEAFEALTVPVEEMPAYVLAAAGRSYLDAEQPETAVELLERAIRMPPVGISTELSLVYAYLDMDRYEDAAALEAQMLEKYPMLLRSADAAVVKGNEARMRAEVVAAIADSSIDRQEAAQNRLEGLLSDSPNNTDIRHELANVYRWRGWLERSLTEYDQVLTMDDSNLYAQVGRANTLLDAQQFAEAETTLNSLLADGNPAPVVNRLSERWSLHNRSELIVSAQTAESTGATFGTTQRAADVYWFTRPIQYNYRAFVHLHDAYSDFPEGDARRRRTGLGAEYREGPWRARGELLADHEKSDFGFAGDFDWRFSDYWLLSGNLGKNSSDMNLRGYRIDVESDVVGVSAAHSKNESVIYSFGLRHARFTDGNRFDGAFGNLRRRVLTRPRSLTHITAEVSTARNSSENVVYFAPRHDFSVMVGAEHDWRIRRRYDRQWSQHTALQVGSYDQSGFAAGLIWRARYALGVSVNDALNFDFGVERSRNLYDGQTEYATTFLLSVQARL